MVTAVAVQGGGTLTANTPATLECTATDGNPTPTMYRWQDSTGASLCGPSTASTYMFTPTAAQSGTMITCFAFNTFSNGAMGQSSMSITLTVN